MMASPHPHCSQNTLLQAPQPHPDGACSGDSVSIPFTILAAHLE